MSSQRNPWSSEEPLNLLRNVLTLAESTGILSKNSLLETESHEKELHQSLPSLKMITIHKEIRELKHKLHQVNLEIQKHLQDKETKDIMNADILEERINAIKEMNSHLETVVRQKNLLIARLQKPFVNDFIRIDASYQSYACEALPQLVPTVSDLPTYLENIDWAVQLDLTDLDALLEDVSGTLACQQTLYQNMKTQRQTMHSLNTKLGQFSRVSQSS